MKHFFIITNTSKDPELAETYRIKDYLEEHGAEVTLAEQVMVSSDDEKKPRFTSDVPGDAEICVVLGGDGTMLQAAANVIDKNIPIIGVNLGRIGYLAEVDIDDARNAMDRLLANDFEIEERMMLKGVLLQGEDAGKVNHALNDIVIARCSSIQVLNFNIFVNNMPLTQYQADGIILSSPTGSTGYNMSAGGPIVDPSAQILLLTPICPHTINARTIVLSEHDKVTVEIGEGRGGADQIVEATLDGSNRKIMKSGDRIDICASDKVTKIVKLSSESFLNTLRKKLV
ncbi:NAD(+)/NADH kinase [Butyrivibrio sp. WCD3002]|uniref:NAD(+)/NADH kinase n=1 Tax=Butyrivibrio sp. WCD3002 TaxID=1280676 RepID=UPI0004239997|nr:NAD(+)/NADH kinase [Butyrivibrio sp. WCD3002]